MSDTPSIDLNSAALGIGRHVSGIADPFNGHLDEFRIAHIQRSDGWIQTTWNNMSNPGATRHRWQAPVWSSAYWGEGERLEGEQVRQYPDGPRTNAVAVSANDSPN